MDALESVLASVRMESRVLSSSHYRRPWSVATRGAPFPILHAVVSGECTLALGDERRVLRTTDIVVLPQGSPHVMASDPDLTPTPVASLGKRDGGIERIEHGGDGDLCQVICGTFQLAHDAGSWLLAALPPLIHLRVDDALTRDFLSSTMRMLDREIASDGSAASISRLTDVLVLQVLRGLKAEDGREQSWLAALLDERIGKALVLIHDHPAGDWSATKLARACGMSRSRFFERFSTLVGESPARYVARWRASTAADLLRHSEISVAEAAEAVGYSSEKAFVQAFRRHHGMSPSAFRRQLSRDALH